MGHEPLDREADLRSQAVERIKARRNFQIHVLAHAVGSVFVFLVWATTEYHNAGGWPTGFRTGRQNHDWDPWIIYPLMAGTMALLIHGWIAFGRRTATEADVAQEIRRMTADR